MDSALVLITLASLGTTSAVLLYAARLIRDERTRSNARVTALADEIGHTPPGAGRQTAPPPYERPAADVPLGRVHREHTPALASRTPVRTPPQPRPAGAGRDAEPDPRLSATRGPAPRDNGTSHGRGTARVALFESASTESASNRMLVPIIGAVIVVLALATTYFVSGHPTASAGPVRAAAGAANVPLELVSLRQARDGETLTVSFACSPPR